MLRFSKLNIFIILILTFFFISNNIYGETPKKLFKRKNRALLKLPFKLINNTPVISARINGSKDLFFILDTGLGTTLITELFEEDSIDLNYAKEISLKGLGKDNPLKAIQSYQNEITIKKLKFESEKIHVLSRDIFKLSNVYGTKINGIIGHSVFEKYIVVIDYQNKKVEFYNPNSFKYKNVKRFVQLPITFLNRKPFINTYAIMENGERIKIKLLVDTGASLAFWLSKESNNRIIIPQKNLNSLIGQGLSGNIYGKIGRIPKLEIGKYALNNIITSFPDSSSVKWMLQNETRNGSIGGEVLKRFKVIIDYRNQIISFQSNSLLKKSFEYNLSGIEIRKPYLDLPIFNIFMVADKSPAKLADIRKDDQIIEINGESVYSKSLDELIGILSDKSNPDIVLKVLRDGKTLSKKILLKPRI